MGKWIFAVCFMTSAMIFFGVQNVNMIKEKTFAYTCYSIDGKISLSSVGSGLDISRFRKNTIVDEQTGEMVILPDNCIITEVK